MAVVGLLALLLNGAVARILIALQKQPKGGELVHLNVVFLSSCPTPVKVP
jgi:hypothetical protein